MLAIGLALAVLFVWLHFPLWRHGRSTVTDAELAVQYAWQRKTIVGRFAHALGLWRR